jgi:hypothetical protein
MAHGKWQMADGKWQNRLFFHLPSAICHVPFRPAAFSGLRY